MRLWLRRLWFCVFAVLLGAQVCAAEDLNAAVRAYKRAVEAHKKKNEPAALKGYAVALKHFAPLAKQGNAEAEYYLGVMYFMGQGVQKDPDQALKLFKASGDQGNADAQFYVGANYLLPHKDITQGLMWTRLSAEQGNQDAQLLLGQAYLQNLKELPADPVKADMWLRLAAVNNLPFYKTQLIAVERRMNPAQIEKAKVLAATWKPKHGLRPDQGGTLKGKPESIGTK